MTILLLFLVLYVSPGCQTQCINCIPPSYQYVVNLPPNYIQTHATLSTSTNNRPPCCPPGVQTIQTSRTVTNNGATQSSQVIMYYNGQKLVDNGQAGAGGVVSGFNQNPVAGNYQNPGVVSNTPAYPNQPIQQPTQVQSPIVAGGQVGSPNDGVNVGGNVEQPPQQPPAIGGGVEPGFHDANTNIGDNGQWTSTGPAQPNPNDGVVIGAGAAPGGEHQIGQGASTIAPAQEVGYQPFVPEGNVQYNTNEVPQQNLGGQQGVGDNQPHVIGGAVAIGAGAGGIQGQNTGYQQGMEGQQPGFQPNMEGQQPGFQPNVQGGQGAGSDQGMQGQQPGFQPNMEGQQPGFQPNVQGGQGAGYDQGMQSQQPGFQPNMEGQQPGFQPNVQGGQGAGYDQGMQGQQPGFQPNMEGQQPEFQPNVQGGQGTGYEQGLQGQQPGFQPNMEGPGQHGPEPTFQPNVNEFDSGMQPGQGQQPLFQPNQQVTGNQANQPHVIGGGAGINPDIQQQPTPVPTNGQQPQPTNSSFFFAVGGTQVYNNANNGFAPQTHPEQVIAGLPAPNQQHFEPPPYNTMDTNGQSQAGSQPTPAGGVFPAGQIGELDASDMNPSSTYAPNEPSTNPTNTETFSTDSQNNIDSTDLSTQPSQSTQDEMSHNTSEIPLAPIVIPLANGSEPASTTNSSTIPTSSSQYNDIQDSTSAGYGQQFDGGSSTPQYGGPSTQANLYPSQQNVMEGHHPSSGEIMSAASSAAFIIAGSTVITHNNDQPGSANMPNDDRQQDYSTNAPQGGFAGGATPMQSQQDFTTNGPQGAFVVGGSTHLQSQQEIMSTMPTTQQSITPQYNSQQSYMDQSSTTPRTTTARANTQGRNTLPTGFTPFYGDMNTQYGNYDTTTISAGTNRQFDPTNTAATSISKLSTIVCVLLGVITMM